MVLTKERLDQIAADYHTAEDIPDKFIEDALQVHSLDWIATQLARCKTILELGYGEGIVTEHLVKTGKQVTQLEGSSILVQKVKDHYGDRVRSVHGLFEEFTTSERYDAVVASHVLEHVDDPVALLKRMRAWVKPRGRVLIIVPNSESIHRRLALLMGLQPRLDSLSARDKLVGHQRVYSLATLLADIESGGFKVRSSRGFFFKPLANSMMLDFSPPLIEAMNAIALEMPTEWMANLGVLAVPRSERSNDR